MSGWIGFNTAVSGLLASQKNLYTTNHNISNVNTKGYSRQQNTQESNNPHNIAGLGFLGTGTNITEVNRVRDSYLDFKYWGENAPVGEWNIKEEALTEISHVFNEPSDSSIRKNLDEFFTSLESLSTNPGDDANRALVREKMISLTKYINSTAENLKSTQNEINFEVGTNIKKINSYSDRISGLNKEIYLIELNGSSANDLRDSRDLLVDELSEIANINASETNGRFKVSIGGVALVDGEVSNKLKYPAPTIINPLNNEEKLYQLEWENGNKLELKSGTLKGLIDVRDGDGVNQKYRGVPFYMKRLNQFARVFADKMNDIHSKGYTRNGQIGTGVPGSGEGDGINMFAADGGGTINASNIKVTNAILNNLDNIATSNSPNAADKENNEIIKKLIAKRDDNDFFTVKENDDNQLPQGTPDDFIKSVLSTLAVDGQQSIRMGENGKVIVEGIDKRRQSESGVSLDEEMSNMVKFQHSYNAAARMITTIDTIYDVTINRLGLVGR